MSARLELPSDMLDDRRPLGLRVDGETRSAIQQLAQLTDRGECVEAAAQAVELLRAGVYELRLACVYMVGLFVERGVAYLPELVRSTSRLVANEVAAPPMLRSSPRVLDTTLQWLLQTLVTHIQFHARQRDESWAQWLRDGEPALATELGDELDQLARAIGEIVEAPVSSGPLAWINRWARGDLARARLQLAARDAAERAAVEAAAEPIRAPAAAPAEPEPDPTPDVDEGLDSEPDPEHDDGPLLDSYAEALHHRRAAPQPEPSQPESPALASLRRKLDGFQRLVDRGDFAKAAFIARDVQRILERFDPVEFLPSLFAGYFRVMSQRLDELRPHLEHADDTPWQVLSRFYQADLEGFLEE
jgi:hypothetical protein